MILNDKIIFSINRACKSSHPGGRPEARREGGLGSDGAEHVIVGAHRVVVHEQVASEGFVVEVAGEVAHRPFEVVAFLDDVPGEVFFAVPLSAVGFLEVVEFVVELHVVIDGLLTVLVAHIRIFEDMVEVVLRHEALVVPLAGEALVVLSHQFGVFLVGVDRLAEVDKIVVGVEAAEVNPQTADAFLTAVFAVCAAVDAGIAGAIAFVFTYCVDECFRRKAEFFEACFHLCRDCQFSEL